MLSNSKIINFIPATDLDISRSFYKKKLGLTLFKEDEFALEFTVDHSSLRITKIAEFAPPNYTVFGWEVADINLMINELMAVGIKFELFDGLTQNELRVCIFPGGSQVAWFKDPDGNTLSITQQDG
jgi:catechol 2,3-dioxygenase-like lactoylglutathione lyase family enzyme